METPEPEMIRVVEEREFTPYYYSVGVDVQKETLEVVLISLPEFQDAIHLEASLVVRRTADYSCWEDMRGQIERLAAGLPGDGIPIPVSVDGGGGWYEWVQEGLRHAWGLRTMEELDGAPAYVNVVIGDSAPSLRKPLWGGRRGRGEKGYKHQIVSVDEGKAQIYQLVREGKFTVASGTSRAIIEQILSERLLVWESRIHRSGRPAKTQYTWVPKSGRIANHALDAVNYALCRANVQPVREI